jgi:DNA-binding transcriptional ArsR family regulator
MSAAGAPLDAEAALRALAHPRRRRMLALVSAAPRASGELADACGWTRPATSQHLKVLRDAGLVEVRKDGNRRLYRAREASLAQLRAFLNDFWAARLGELDEQLRRTDPHGEGGRPG